MKRVVRAGSPEVLQVIGDSSSPSAAETSFRELDDVFLQTQTRIWLGEVLHIRFDEQTAIADLLADGELLFQVSKVVWKMLLKKYVELKHSKVYIYERTSFGKSDGRYMPYPKIDSFLKICQILGLTGVDLFSSSDVVERRDVRRVCRCIRSLSKKARSKNLNVPDFDIVTYAIAMPTELVGGICRNLEQSQCSSSSSNSFSSQSMESREISRHRSPGAQCRHYDSHSESDEAESSLTEFEFQSPLSNASYDSASVCSIVDENLPAGNSSVDGNLSELGAKFSLDTQKQHGAVDEGRIQNWRHSFTAELHNKSSSSRTECQIGEGESVCFADTGFYQNFVSTYEDSRFELEEALPVDAEESFVPFGPLLWSKDHEDHVNCFPTCSPYNCDMNLDHQNKEIMKAPNPSAQTQTAGCRQGDNSIRSENMEDPNHGSLFGLQDTVHEKIPCRASTVSVGGKEHSTIGTFLMDPKISTGHVSSPGNYIKLETHASDFPSHGINDANNPEVLADRCLSMGTAGLDQTVTKNGLKRKAAGEFSAAQVYSSSSDMHDNSAGTANSFLFPRINSLGKGDLCEPKLDLSANGLATALEEEAMELNNGTGHFATEKFSLSDEVDRIGRDSSVLIDSFTYDEEGLHASRESEDMGCNTTFSITTESEQIPSEFPERRPSPVRDCHTVSHSDSPFMKDHQISPESHCDPWDANCKNDSLTSILLTDNLVNEPKHSLLPTIPSAEHCVTVEEKEESIDTCACNIEMEVDEKLNDPIMPRGDEEDIMVNGLPDEESEICRSNPSNGFNNQLMEGECNSGSGWKIKMKGVQEQDLVCDPCETFKDLPVEPAGNFTEELCADHSLHIDVSSISRIELIHAGGIESGKIMSLLTGNHIPDEDVLSNLGSHHINRSEIHGLDVGEINSSTALNIVCTQGLIDLDSLESAGFTNVNPEAPSTTGASETICTHDLVCNYEHSSTGDSKDGSMQNHQIFPHSTPPIVEGEISEEKTTAVNNEGGTLLVDESLTNMKQEEADDNQKVKDTEECEKEPVVKLDCSAKNKKTGKHTKMVKSVAGTVTLLGAFFLFQHVRRKRNEEKSNEIAVPQQTPKLNQEVPLQPLQKKVVTSKANMIYPGERLRF